MPVRNLLIIVLVFIANAMTFAQDSVAEIDYDPSVCWDDEAESTACLAMMASHPQPALDRIREDRFTLSNYSFWRVGPEAVNLYDAPGGQVIGQMPAGFNFVHAIDTSVEGWIQRVGGEWISRDDAKFVRASTFKGMLLPEDWQYPFAIILDQTGIYASTQPGIKGSADSGYVTRRYDLVHIYAQEEDAEGNLWYMIGPRQWIRQEFVAKFAPAEQPEEVSGRWVAIDLFEQTLIAFEDELPVYATLVSSGLPDWSTNEGIFQIWARLDRDSMSGATGAPDAYALQDVPWTMYFDGSISLHGTYWHDDFGYRRSHGCVNLSISDARWIYEWMAEAEPDIYGDIVNSVVVFSSDEYTSE